MSEKGISKKNIANYQVAWEELQNRARDAFDNGDVNRWAELEELSESLQKWLKEGQNGPCPVEQGLRDEGITVRAGDGVVHQVQEENNTKPAKAADKKNRDASPQQKRDAKFPGNGGAASDAVAAEENKTAVDAAGSKVSPASRTLESPETTAMRKQVEEARRSLADERWLEALALSAHIKQQAKDVPDLREAAEDIYDRARIELETRLNEALDAGDRARAAGDKSLARQHYTQALVLDPENAHAHNALIEIEGSALQERIDRLRAQLKKRQNLEELGQAIYRAEALDAEGRLDAETQRTLRIARAYFDETRKEMGITTTQVRFGALQTVKEARDKVDSYLAEGKEKIWDATTNRYVPVEDYRRDADRRLEEKSEETAQYEIDIAKRNLPAYPEVAIARLENALQLPFHESHRRKIEETLVEARQLRIRKQKAEELVKEAEQEENPLSKFLALLAAQREFPFWDSQGLHLETARQNAANDIAREVKKLHSKAESDLELNTPEKYEEALERLDKADALLGKWPVPPDVEKLTERGLSQEEAESHVRYYEKNQILYDLEASGRELRKRVKIRTRQYQNYTEKAKQIREAIKDPHSRQTAWQLFKELEEDHILTQFTDFKRLRSEMDQYAEVGELLAQAHRARDKGDWGRTYELATKILESGQAGALKEEVSALEREAGEELDIARARQYLQNQEVIEANKIISRIIHSASEKRQEELNERLREEQAQIEQAVDADKIMRPIFEQGLAELGLSGDARLKVFLHHELDWDIPATAIKGIAAAELKQILKQAEVRGAVSVQKAAEAIHAQLMKHLTAIAPEKRVKALRLFRHVQGETWRAKISSSDDKDANTVALPPYRLSLRTADAGRMARLVSDSLRMDVLSTIKETYANRGSEEMDDERIDALAEYARLLREIGLLEGEEDRRAARWFQLQRGRRLADAYESRGQWDDVVRIWEDLAISLPGDESVRLALTQARQRQQVIQEVLEKAKEAREKGRYLVAIQILSAALEKDATPVLRDALDTTLRQARSNLAAEAEEKGNKNDIASISRAVLALQQLKSLEKQAGLSEDACMASKLMRELETRVMGTFPDIARRLPALGRMYQILQEADTLDTGMEADAGGIKNKWDKAVRDGNFAPLRQYVAQIEALDLPADDIPDYVDFRERLHEWEMVSQKLRNDRAQAVEAFEDENFVEVAQLLRANKGFPAQGVNGVLLQHITPEEYAHIREILSARVRAMDAYGAEGAEEIVGWDVLEQAARNCQENLKRWEKWESRWKRVLGEASKRIDEWDAMDKGRPLAERQEALERILDASLACIEVLAPGGPTHDGKRLPIRSRQAKEIQKAGADALEVVQRQIGEKMELLERVVEEIDKQGGFPTTKEFSAAARKTADRDCESLKILLQRARQIGPGCSVLSRAEFQQILTQAHRGNLAPLRNILRLTDYLQLPDFPKEEDLASLGSDALLGAVAQGLALPDFIRRARQQAVKGNQEMLKHFLKFSSEVRRLREADERSRIQLYEVTLQQNCGSKKPRPWFRIFRR